jgi:hypothetical protein
MTNAEKLKNLLELEIIPDLEAAIDELFAVIDKSKNATKEQKEDLEEMREMRTECFAIVEEIKRDELDEEEATELLEELVLEELEKIQPGTKIRTLDFVNTIVNKLREKTELSEELEVEIRGKIVDILWELQRKKVIQFEETLIRFEKLKQQS